MLKIMLPAITIIFLATPFFSLASEGMIESEINDLRNMAKGHGMPDDSQFYQRDHTDAWYKAAWVYYGKYVIKPTFSRNTEEPFDENLATSSCLSFIFAQQWVAKKSLGLKDDLPMPLSDPNGKWVIDEKSSLSDYQSNPANAATLSYSQAIFNAFVNICAKNPAAYLNKW